MVKRVGPLAGAGVIPGEGGTGKGRVARAIHYSSSRAAKRFVSLNCAALADSLAEAQLFGHTKNAFTGAARDEPGLARAADAGTRLLDKISELAPALQHKLTRVRPEQ